MGDRITGGDIYATVHENTLMEHRVMLPPNARGTITYMAPHGQYNIEEEVIEVEFNGTKKVGNQHKGCSFRHLPALGIDCAVSCSVAALLLMRTSDAPCTVCSHAHVCDC